ncbi:PIN domain-containing protein [Brucella anthropi]|uniref:PIN domain-containing protein n=1 Tax=Brucella anthropi TaxID=529 RepID=UPI0021570405|nr:PIN domain-containing protein [Brucella anthropi]MCR8493013.1 PIN domain-containing protein [Brucella anthropi]
MAFSPVVAVCDACILYPFHLRNVIVQASVDRLFQARWTDAIHDEWRRNLVANTPNLSIERLEITKRLMNGALPSASIAGYEKHIQAVRLPDPDDRHVAAAAIEAGASTIITWNLRDFPIGELRKHGLARQTPDAFLTALYEQVPERLTSSLANARRNLSRSRVSASDFIGILRDQRLTKLTAQIEKHLGDL